MVVFTCTHCGESLQKPRVEKHYQTTCKNHPISVSCMDCFKDFKMQEYAAHVKCVSEEERYAAKGAVMNPKKGEMKQSSWIETVNAIIAKEKNAKPEVRKLLETISKHNNVPRKKNKFVNFINSTTGGSAKPDDVEAVWNLLESHKPAAPAAQEKSKEGNLEHVNSNKRKSEMIADDTAESSTPQKKKKANKPKEEGEVSEAAAPATTGADAEQKPSKKKKADKKPEEKPASESDGAAAADKNKNAKRKKRKSGDADGESPATNESVPSVPAAPTATNNAASAQNGDVPKKKKKTTTPAPAAETPAESAKKESPKKKKSQPAANNTAPADAPAPAAGNAEVAPKKNKKKAGSGDDKTETNATEDKAPKKKEKKTKSLANGDAATDKKSAADGDKKKDKKAKETNDKPVKSNWEESVRTIIKSKPSGMTKDELIEQLIQRQAAAGEEIQSKGKLRKHIIKLLYKMSGVKVDKDCITPAN